MLYEELSSKLWISLWCENYAPYKIVNMVYCFCFLSKGMKQAEVESRTQGSKPRPSHKKNPRQKTDFPRTDRLEAKDRNAWGQDQEHKAQVFSKKRSSRKKIETFFREISGVLHTIKVFINFLRGLWRGLCRSPKQKKIWWPWPNFNESKNSAVPDRGQGIFEDLKASRPRLRTWTSKLRTLKCVLEDAFGA